MTHPRLQEEIDKRLKWDWRFLKLARHIAQWSKDPSTKVGCVVVGPDREIRSTGFNGFPRGVLDSNTRLQDRQLKYKLVCHAEENAIVCAARVGVSLRMCTLYSSWVPCVRCACSLIQAGIVEVVYPECEIPERWQDDFQTSVRMLNEAKVTLRALRPSDAEPET